MSDDKELEEIDIPYIPRLDAQGRVEIIFPTRVAVTSPKPRCEILAPLMQEGDGNGPYTNLAGDYLYAIDQTEPIPDDDEEVERKISSLLEDEKRGYHECGYDPQFERYEKRTPQLREQFYERERELRTKMKTEAENE